MRWGEGKGSLTAGSLTANSAPLVLQQLLIQQSAHRRQHDCEHEGHHCWLRQLPPLLPPARRQGASAISLQSACSQLALSMHSACTQHALSLQSLLSAQPPTHTRPHPHLSPPAPNMATSPHPHLIWQLTHPKPHLIWQLTVSQAAALPSIMNDAYARRASSDERARFHEAATPKPKQLVKSWLTCQIRCGRGATLGRSC